MNLFLSWSGNLSHEVAKALVWWIPQVLQAVKPWISSQDIEKGARWFEEIGESLSATDYGILCLTSSNLYAPWILFEAGALSKSLGQARVCPLLVNIKNADLVGPLAQFNTTGITKDEILRLAETLNARLPPETKRTESQLHETLEVWWPRLKERLDQAIAGAVHEEAGRSVAPKRKVEDVLDEILELTRNSAQQLARLTSSPLQETIKQERIWPRGSVADFAAQLNRPVEALIEQLAAAGVTKLSPGSPLADADKAALLAYLRSEHSTGGTERKKIVLTRKSP